MGDRSITEGRMQAQRMDGLIGKIARINADGSIPKDNPFVGKEGVPPAMWSLGHRNSQSAALHPTTGELWEVEHGTRGGDEINIARKGKDYGWPTIAYGIEYRGGPITGGIQQQAGMEQPIYYWDPIIGPSGMAFYTATLFPAWQGSLFVGGHGTRDLVRLSLEGEKITGEERLLADQKFAVRDVRQGPDGALYLLTDGADGKLLKLVPSGSDARIRALAIGPDGCSLARCRAAVRPRCRAAQHEPGRAACGACRWRRTVARRRRPAKTQERRRTHCESLVGFWLVSICGERSANRGHANGHHHVRRPRQHGGADRADRPGTYTGTPTRAGRRGADTPRTSAPTIVDSGTVAITAPDVRGEHVVLDTLGPGGMFGELSLLDGGPRSATVRAVTDSTLLALPRDAFHAFLRQRPDAAIDLLQILGARQRASTVTIRGLQNPNLVIADATTRWQRASDVIATVAASQAFTLSHLAWFGGWILLNSVAAAGLLPAVLAFDRFPFGLLTLIVSLESIFLSIFVLVSQNRQSERDRIRTDLDYQVNVKAHVEIVGIGQRLDRIERALARPEPSATGAGGESARNATS